MRRRTWWLLFWAWALAIYATVPFVRALQQWVAEHWGRGFFAWAVLAVVVLAAAGGAILLRRLPQPPTRSAWFWLLLIAAAFAAWTVHLWRRPGASPVEAVHLIEYAILGALAWAALRQRAQDALTFAAAIALGAIVGTIDEMVQWAVPGRYGDLYDIVLNAGTCALSQLAVLGVARPRLSRPSTTSQRRLVRLAAAEAALLGLWFVNTPQVVDWYTTRVPALAYLRSNPDAMSEYGHRYHVPDIGTFTSRFTLAELAATDRARAAEAAAVLDRYPPGRYNQFCTDYPSGRDPFVHEARVHAYNRDYHIVRARKAGMTAAEVARHATVAWRENLILERYFPTTLARSRFVLKPEARAFLEAHHDPNLPFESLAGIHLTTFATQAEILTSLALLGLGLLVLDRRLGRHLKEPPP